MKFTRSIWPLLLLTFACRSSNDQESHTVIAGSWRTACLISEDGASSSRVSYAFADDHSVLRRKELFADPACQTAAGIITHAGTFALAVREFDADYDIDLIFTAVSAMPTSEANANAWNAQDFCGLSTWTNAGSQSVLGAADPACESYGTQRVEYRDVVEVTEGVSLVFGSTLEAQQPRPDSIHNRPVDQIFLHVAP